MEILNKLRRWLGTCPGWTEEPEIDSTDGNRAGWGLFPQGTEVLSRQEDVAGNVTCRFRCRFRLEILVPGEENRQETAEKIMALCSWINNKSICRAAPALGDEPASETVRAEKGRLADIRRPGIPVYEIILTAEYTKYYEVK